MGKCGALFGRNRQCFSNPGQLLVLSKGYNYEVCYTPHPLLIPETKDCQAPFHLLKPLALYTEQEDIQISDPSDGTDFLSPNDCANLCSHWQPHVGMVSSACGCRPI